ncbi:hypothetical protein GCM10022254_65220 [Actinomadura meridiana]|uniref:Exo-alpha-sialidase n=1 Tax=Actinomadura meridiana TaxID=559626 RepID=A0ABP8CKH9_9ACTN
MVGLVVLAGGVIVGASRRGGDEPIDSGETVLPGVVAVGSLFAADPAAATDGLVQELSDVASTGSTVVAAGSASAGGPGGSRARFLVSTDAGHKWSVADVRAANGSMPPSGDSPRHVSGWSGHWIAFGTSSGGGAVAWTSRDAATWTRHQLGAAFTPSDRVTGVTRTRGGFVAVGVSGGRAVVWTSADGAAWQRTAGIPGAASLDGVTSFADILVTHGASARKVTKKKGKKKVTRTVRSDGLWRSTDAGKTWTPVTVPQAQGSYGPIKGLTFGPGGFAVVREGRRATGPKNRRRLARFGVLFTSADGQRWQAASRFGGSGVELFGGAPDGGLAVLVRGAKGAHAVLRTDDGRAWRPGGTVAARVDSSGLAVADGTLVIAGREGGDAYLSGVDLRTVPGAVRPERSIRALAAGPDRGVAVGSTNGGSAIWTAPDGHAWSRARFPAAPGWLSDVVRGGKGWLAVGRTSGSAPGPLAMTSQDGSLWERSEFPGGPPPVAAASGPSGYVAVGLGAAWRSTDLTTWTRTALTGAAADVTATTRGYVAVGGSDTAPAVWTSPDGASWTPAKLPSGLATGRLTQVAAHGDALVAIGAGATALVSTDGGTTWTPQPLGAGITATAVTATQAGFVLAASTSGQDGAVLASADGVSWRLLQVPGLSGPGGQHLTALTTTGLAVLGTGVMVDARSETPLLWWAPVPE